MTAPLTFAQRLAQQAADADRNARVVINSLAKRDAWAHVSGRGHIAVR